MSRLSKPRQDLEGNLNGRGGTFYWPEELAKMHGKKVPLTVNHDLNSVGEAVYNYDPINQQLNYEANVTDPHWQKLLDKMKFKVSFRAFKIRDNMIMHPGTGKIYNAPILGEPRELSIVDIGKEGIPESTIEVAETAVCGTPIVNCDEEVLEFINPIIDTTAVPTTTYISTNNTSVKENLVKEITLTEPKVEKTEEVAEAVALVVEKPIAPIEVVEKKIEAKAEVSEEKIAPVIEDKTQSMKDVLAEIREHWSPKSEVSESNAQSFVDDAYTDEQARAIMAEANQRGSLYLKMDKTNWIGTHTATRNTGSGDVQEAVTPSGTIAAVSAGTDIKIIIGAKSVIPVRQYGMYESLSTGNDTARFFKIDVPDAGAITESVSTNITAVAHTLTSVDVTASIRGWRQTILKAQLEDYPAKFLNSLKETARLESIRDEHKLIVQTVGATAVAYGGTTTAPYHISGSDGSAVVGTTTEDATGEFDEDGFTFAKQYLTQQGQDPSAGNLVAFLSPRAIRTLSTSTGITTFTQYANPSITKLGQMEMLYGIDIISSTQLLVANNSYRNLVCVKGAAWALVSQRDMELEMQKQIAGQYWDVVWTHRIGVGLVDKATYVIVSSKQD